MSTPSAAPAQRRLVVVIPALNEAATIERVIRAIPASFEGISDRSVVVVDDGSTDDTAVRARMVGAAVVSHGINRGVGVAFQTGLREALRRGADVIVHIDSDGQFDPADIRELIRPVLDGRADITTCTRFSDLRHSPRMSPMKVWGNRVVRVIINAATGQRFTDVSCGFRAYSREAALRLTLFGKFTYTHEVILDAVQKGLRIVEVPLTVRGEREFGQSRVARNVVVYGFQWLAIFFRAFRDSSPFQVFGSLASVIGLAGIAAGVFVFTHWFRTGQTFPYRSLVILAGVLILLSAFFFTIALLADMLRRQRVLTEELLYLARRTAYDRKDG
jgi:glycosyltransferase involved in cell wall biosynthesis